MSRAVGGAGVLAACLLSGCHMVFGIDEFTEAAATSTAPMSTDTEPVGPVGGAGGEGAKPIGEAGGPSGDGGSAGSAPVPNAAGQGGSGAGGAGPGSGASGAGGDGAAGEPANPGGGSNAGGSAGQSSAECAVECAGDTPICLDGACVACSPGTGSCSDAERLYCNDVGSWESLGLCPDGSCIDGACVPPSCQGLPSTCGVEGDENCCLSPTVDGGRFWRQNDRRLEVTLSDFRLDAFEVTVGRFRNFLAARDSFELQEGMGAYPHAPESGWKASWPLGTASQIEAGIQECYAATYTEDPGSNETLPIDCVNWYEAFAFCAWDGGYLPTDAQWSYAAYGGSEQRYYPWSDPPTNTELSDTLAVFNCTLPEFTYECLRPVGSLPLGASRFGQLDLAGNVIEWVMDPYAVDSFFECDASNVNCLATSGSERGLRGGSYFGLVQNEYHTSDVPSARYIFGNDEPAGFRCARAPLAPESPESCAPDDIGCDGATARRCDRSGQWVPMEECEFGCRAGTCNDCTGSEAGCSGNQLAVCVDGRWSAGTECSGSTPICRAGQCVALCDGQVSCGANGDQDCCGLLEVPAANEEFDRLNGADAPASVSPFQLERFEVTVGRFREFVDAYPGSRPEAGAGAHPGNPSSGWQSEWDALLPATREELVILLAADGRANAFPACTYRESTGPGDARAMNCVSWYEAFAFCAFIGGRLPTFAEWKYAALGGDEQRVYPWSVPATSDVVDTTYANYAGVFCPSNSSDLSPCIARVGASALGVGKFGHLDLVGNVAEYTLDSSTVVSVPCADCVDLGSTRGRLGGSWDDDESDLTGDARASVDPSTRSGLNGFRCVRP